MSLLTNLIRLTIPRSVRNTLRRPKATLQRMMDKSLFWLGRVAALELHLGWRVRCHPMCAQEWVSFVHDPEQKAEISAFIAKAVPGMRFLDVGTHWGVFTLAALHFGGADSRCIGIEASAEAARIYRLNLSLNQAEGRVRVINAACGDQLGSLEMLTTGAGGADYFVIPSEERSDTITVSQVTVDSVCSEHRFDPTHLKIDVEGFEEEVLQGAMATLENHRPLIFLELHGMLIRGRKKQPEQVLNLLRSMGYSNWESLDGEKIDADWLSARQFNARFVAFPGKILLG
jgi:FkbM family methyltransferase